MCDEVFEGASRRGGRDLNEPTWKTIAFILTAFFVIWWIDDATGGFLLLCVVVSNTNHAKRP